MRCKRCRKCKPLSAFYRRSNGVYFSSCKLCVCAKVRARIELKEKDLLWRSKERERCRAKRHRYAINRVNHKAVNRRWCLRNKDKRRANILASRAQKIGLLVKPEKCQSCHKKTTKLEKHHPDYTKPLCVVWLCKPCHGVTRRKSDSDPILKR